MRNLFQKKLNINSKTAAVNIILVANALVWYLCAFKFLKTSVNDNLIIVGVNLLALILSAILGSYIIEKLENRLKFLVYWTAGGVFLSILPLAIESAAFPELIAISAVIGGYFGLGLPVFMGYYAASTETENRARLSGVTIFIMGVMTVLLSIISSQDSTLTTIVLAVWRTFGLVSIIFLNPTEIKINKKEKTSYKALVKSSSLLLYFAPWLMFSLVNNLALPILSNLGFADILLYSTVETVLAGIFALFFGFIADYIGRKRLLLVGFVLIGLGYAVLGVFSNSQIGWWFYTCADGIAFGAFTTLFLLTIWGDLADKRDSEKYYVIGFIPYLFSSFLQLSIGQYVANTVTNVTMVFSFASFFLFAAVLPLYLAPETLPEKAMKDRNLKSYLDKAQKLAEKEAAKKQHNEKAETEPKETLEVPESSKEEKLPEYEEAQKLAEQYY